MMAFEKFKQINELSEITIKHKEWLKDYEGLNYSIAVDEKHLIKWQTEPKKYKPEVWQPSINLIKERADRLKIEFDGDEQEAKSNLEKVYQRLKEMGIGFIRSSHKGKSDYLWVEFTRQLSTKEKEAFLKWIAPEGSEIDLNFCSSEKVFQVLYAVHWRHSYQREMPIEFYIGKKIDFDSLGIRNQKGLTKVRKFDSFEYETFIKPSINYTNKTLELWGFNDYKKLKEDKSFLVEKVIYPKSVNMIYSPPGEFKSLLCLDMALSIATGRAWLKFKTKKFPVLYCDKENSDQIIRKRLLALHKGKDLKRNTFPLYILRRNGDLLDSNFIQQLKEVIKGKCVKVVFFDTMHRFADYDENKSDDINRIYVNVFQPLVDELGCSVVFLHHTTKTGDYRGSGDFLGMVDTAYSIIREKNGKVKTNKFRVVNEKCRAGEIDNIIGEVDFAEDETYIKLLRLNESVEAESKINKLKQLTEKIKEFVQEGSKVTRKDIQSIFDIGEVEYTIPTLRRSLKWLVDNKYFDYDDKKHIYWKVLR